MTVVDFGNFFHGMTIARSDFAQVFARRAVKSVDGFAMLAGGHQQFVEGAPFVSPVGVKADTFAEFVFVDLAPPPFLEHMLMTRENGFDAEHNGTVSAVGSLFQQGSGKPLRGGKSVIVADKDDVGGGDGFGEFTGIDDGIVGTKSLVEIAQVLAASAGVSGTHLALHAGQRMPLHCVAPVSEGVGGGHSYGRWSSDVGRWLFAAST